MKNFFYIVFSFCIFSFSINAQSVVTSSLTINPDTNISNQENNLDYIVLNASDKKIRSDFRELKINIAPNSQKGMLSLEIISSKHWNLLMELKNGLEDVLLFEEVELHEGLNTIPFETDDAAINMFTLKMSESSSNYSASLSLLKR